MPKKLYEPASIFTTLLAETLDVDPEFSITTPDSVPEEFADALINEYYPPQSELPLA